MLYTYSFSSSISTIAFLILNNYNDPIVLALIGGLGASIADISILKFLSKINLDNELNMLSKEKFLEKVTPEVFKTRWFLTISGLITIASPLPDELGILLIKQGKLLSTKNIFFIGLVANTIGIYNSFFIRKTIFTLTHKKS